MVSCFDADEALGAIEAALNLNEEAVGWGAGVGVVGVDGVDGVTLKVKGEGEAVPNPLNVGFLV